MSRNPDACEWRFMGRESREGGGWYRWYTLVGNNFRGTLEQAQEEARKWAPVVGGQCVPVPVLQRQREDDAREDGAPGGEDGT